MRCLSLLLVISNLIKTLIFESPAVSGQTHSDISCDMKLYVKAYVHKLRVSMLRQYCFNNQKNIVIKQKPLELIHFWKISSEVPNLLCIIFIKH